MSVSTDQPASPVCDNDRAESSLIQKIFKSVSPIFRGKRFKIFLDKLQPSTTDSVLDVGGFPQHWTPYATDLAVVDILNIHEIDHQNTSKIRTIIGDGTALEFADESYDIVFSNSVIEHLSNWENQQKFAEEMQRVGKKIWIQTPAREFFLEPHFLTPFIHWVPPKLRTKMLRYFTVWGWMVRPTPEEAKAAVEEIRLLGYKEMKTLFPDCKIYRERFLGLFTKSYTAYRL